jgi:predicted ATP-grasp superfamily ATP-dependent carboligase
VVSNHLLILGASVRAAAFSALRSGYSPIGGDLFADADLMALCPAMATDDYPRGLETIAAESPPADWLYTGGLENHPWLIDRIASRRLLLGNAGAILRTIRNPRQVAETVRAASLLCPDVTYSSRGLPRDGTWLRKPRRSSGGAGIISWEGRTTRRWESACYFQRRIEGLSCAAVYVAAAGQARLLGVTEQLVGAEWSGAGPFQYAGSIGPLELDVATRCDFERLGDALASLGLVGLFGVDCLLAGGRPWLVEVNPRYPASAEVLERATGVSLVGLHVAACRKGVLPDQFNPPEPGQDPGLTHCGKAVLYGTSDRLVDAELFARLWQLRGDADGPCVADIPRQGTTIRRGWPALTVLADGPDQERVREALVARIDQARRELACGMVPTSAEQDQ